MFWYGFIIGIFIGTNVAVVVLGLLFAARRNDAEMERRGDAETSPCHPITESSRQ